MRICFITSLNLVSNPRLVKEIGTALKQGYQVEVVCFRFPHAGESRDRLLRQQMMELGAQIHLLVYSRQQWFSWLFVQALYACLRVAYRLRRWPWLARLVAGRKTAIFLRHQLKRLHLTPADWVVAHNPGSWAAAEQLAQKWGARLGIDVEDYHPGEAANHSVRKEMELLLTHMISIADYISYASAPIQARCEKLVLQAGNAPSFVLPNAFPRSEFPVQPQRVSSEALIQLVWFSQHINVGRGLEQVLACIAANEFPMHVTLFGELNASFAATVLSQYSFVTVKSPLPQQELHGLLAAFDIGLAIEPGKDENNVLALSNKLFAYAQAGVFVLASATSGQQSFFDQFPEYGIVTTLDSASLTHAFKRCIATINEIREASAERHRLAHRFDWESYEPKLISAWHCLS